MGCVAAGVLVFIWLVAYYDATARRTGLAPDERERLAGAEPPAPPERPTPE